jgi:hypothetical protein
MKYNPGDSSESSFSPKMFLESQIDITKVVLKMTLNTKEPTFSILAKCPPSSNADFDS